ncbi:MAG TPA: hypothetical protein VLZ06_03815 [Solirubrobacteraceae bacterium]|nr:hypothetical protein [Solirubrobacteraceae bacterium]
MRERSRAMAPRRRVSGAGRERRLAGLRRLDEALRARPREAEEDLLRVAGIVRNFDATCP